MNYIEVKLVPEPCSEEICDVLSALLAPLGYDSFCTELAEDAEPSDEASEMPVALKAYVTEQQWDSEALNDLLANLPIEGTEVSWIANVVEMQDWNQEWEQSQQFEPIVISDQCCVHSPAAPADMVPACRYDVIIDPKMSFGSGTHETTSQLLEEILGMGNEEGGECNEEGGECNEERVMCNEECVESNGEGGKCNEERGKCNGESVKRALDMGTGTGVLGILCGLLGYEVRAIEIDDWVAANAVDNVLYNGLAGKVMVECGDASLLTEGPTYDLVLANINRNVLVNDMPRYVNVMRPGATLMMSGFYEEDVPIIRDCAESLGLTYVTHRSRNNWVAIRFRLDRKTAL